MFFNIFFGCIFIVFVLYRGVNILSHFAGLPVFFELYVGGYKVFFCFNFHFVFCKASFCFRFKILWNVSQRWTSGFCNAAYVLENIGVRLFCITLLIYNVLR